MPKVKLNATAPSFTLTDLADQPVSPADFRGRQNVLLVFNRGFI